MKKNTIAYQWRDYDPVIARFNKIDRFAEKYYDQSTYHFTRNNPVFFKEIKGDSINVSDLYKTNDDGSYVNAKLVKIFEDFANTKTGKAYLSKFASKGQEIAGITFDSDGEFHESGIDLNFDTDLSTGGGEGETSLGDKHNHKKDSNGRFQINLSLGKGGGKESNIIKTITHEFFVHALEYAKDIVDNGKVDYSNMSKIVRENQEKSSMHHYQEWLDNRNNKSDLSNKAYPILINVNKKYNKKSSDEIWNHMWDFVY